MFPRNRFSGDKSEKNPRAHKVSMVFSSKQMATKTTTTKEKQPEKRHVYTRRRRPIISIKYLHSQFNVFSHWINSSGTYSRRSNRSDRHYLIFSINFYDLKLSSDERKMELLPFYCFHPPISVEIDHIFASPRFWGGGRGQRVRASRNQLKGRRDQTGSDIVQLHQICRHTKWQLCHLHISACTQLHKKNKHTNYFYCWVIVHLIIYLFASAYPLKCLIKSNRMYTQHSSFIPAPLTQHGSPQIRLWDNENTSRKYIT